VKQVVQSVGGGPVRVVELPRPEPGPTEVLVRTEVTTISAGTEGAVTALAQASLLQKAKARPDLVKQVFRKASVEGVGAAYRAVRSRLGEDVPLGYSGCGRVVAVGEYVADIRVGDLVATAGQGWASHGDYQVVPGLLCARVPEGVTAADASMATIGSIALHGLRTASPTAGEKVVVIGLGLLGQLTTRLALASGCDVFGIDVSDFPVERARSSGATAAREGGGDTNRSVLEWSRGRGADVVIITAADKSSRIIDRVPAICRDRARVVVVGDIGLHIARTPWYEKELDLRFARSYGPGRYERSYEDWGVDMPIGYVRWTEGRNLEAFLDLVASGRLAVSDLATHSFPVAEAPEAYRLIEERTEPFLAVQLTYPELSGTDRARVDLPARTRGVGSEGPRIGLIGAGAFARTVLLPAFKDAGVREFVAVASATGRSAVQVGEQFGFRRAVSTPEQVIEDPDVDTVVICTPHDSHARLAAAALRAGKHVYCEKPLALTIEELEEVEAAYAESDATLFVGYNRRWSEPHRLVKEHFAGTDGPLVITYRVNAGRLPERHWYHDRRQGGRLLGEVCHFVDTCIDLVDAPVTATHVIGDRDGELLLSQNLAVTMSFADGSVAVITYAADGHPGVEKERIEVLGRGRSALLVDFADVTLDGALARKSPQDKGHRASVREAVDPEQGKPPSPRVSNFSAIRALLDTTRGPSKKGDHR
jgi:predicted dehydrogenase/threonine dehydrogenase-like Zn-dependent dehydrogenase